MDKYKDKIDTLTSKTQQWNNVLYTQKVSLLA